MISVPGKGLKRENPALFKSNSNEKLIGRARGTQNFRKIYWDVELVSVPQEGRLYLNTPPLTTIPFRILTSINNDDLSITINIKYL